MDVEPSKLQSQHVSVQNVGKVYESKQGPVEALSSVSLLVQRGQFVSILGPSGCGKSTLLMIVAGLLEPSTGAIEIDSQKVVGPRVDNGIVFQTPVLLPWRPVLQNVLYPIELQKKPKNSYIEMATQLLELTGLTEFREHLPTELSGGMQQRVAICRSLIHNPSLLLMDEPFSALDAMTRDLMNQELLRIWEEYRKTVIFVTHSIREAIFLSDKIAVMSRRPGRILREFSVEIERPRRIDVQETVKFNNYVRELREAIEISHSDRQLERIGD
jgi:NitT/TauT family transport system ATP-binding protein